ncbi:hypothetical protein [Enterococcus sp. LJL120]
MNEPKSPIHITKEVDSFEKAKELLADLEVLNETYLIQLNLAIVPPVNLEEFYKPI